MMAYGFLDDEALMNDSDNEGHDDIYIDQLVEDLMQRFEEQRLTPMNG